MLINLVLLLGTFTGTIGLQWTSSVTFPNSTRVNTCFGGTATFPWSFSLSSSEQLIDIEWHHVYNNRETLLAAYVSHNFLPYGDSERRLSMVGNAGLQLTGVTSSDIGEYSVRVNLNGDQQSSQTAFLHEPEAPVTVSGNLRAYIMSTTPFPVINGESHLQLGCGTFTSLGQPPISVTWRTPSGQFLSSTYDNRVFALTLPNPLEGGNYTCQLNGVPTGQSCLQNNPLFHTTSTVYVDDVTWSLQLLRNDMKWLTKAYVSQFELLDACLANLHVMTSGKTVILRVDLMDFNGTTVYAICNTFNVSGPEDNYRLQTGTCYGPGGCGLQSENNKQFSTYDRDHDTYRGNCAELYHAAWWYRDCSNSNLNGRYYSSNLHSADSIWCSNWHSYQSLKRVEMKIRV